MKQLIILLAVMLGLAVHAAEITLPTIAVMPLQDTSEGKPQQPWGFMGEAANRIMRRTANSLIISHRFVVLERQQMGALLKEGKFSNGLGDESSAIRLGKQMGASIVVIGEVYAGARSDDEGAVVPESGEGSLVGPKPLKLPWYMKAQVPQYREECYRYTATLSLRFVDTETGVITDAVELKAMRRGMAQGDHKLVLDTIFDAIGDKLDAALSGPLEAAKPRQPKAE